MLTLPLPSDAHYKEGRPGGKADDGCEDDFNNPLPGLLKARNRCKQYSPLYNALNSLYEETKVLPYRIINHLGKQANILIDDLTKLDGTASINFLTECKKQLGDQHPIIKNILFAIAISATVLLLGTIIGLGVSLGLGALNAYVGMLTLFAGSLVLCTSGLTYNSHRLFPQSPIISVVKTVAEVARLEDIELAYP